MKKLIFLASIILLQTSCDRNGAQSDAYGNFEAREVTVSAQGNGQILWLKVEEGMPLESGDVMGVIDTSDLYFRKLQLVAQRTATLAQYPVLKAQAQVQQQQIANLEKDRNRTENMLKDGAATQKQYDDIEGAINMATRQVDVIRNQQQALESQIRVIEEQIAQIDNSIQKSMIINPFKGVVLVKYAEAGEITIPTKPLYKIGDVEDMKLKAYVSETQLSSIKIGQAAEVLIDGKDKRPIKMDGEVSWISDKAEFTPKIIQTREERINLVYAVKITVKNDGTLKIGMPGEVNFK